MQQKTKTEPDHTRFGFNMKAVAASVIVVAVGLGVGSTTQLNSPAAHSIERNDASERKSLIVLDMPLLGELNSSSEASITVYTADMLEQTVTPPPPPPPGYALLEAARAQIGWSQDCTALVENSLRSLGHSVGDLAPMSFGGYGYQVSPDEAQPGDIMMRSGHVAIYAGDGMAVHGGFNGTTIETNIGSSPHDYAVIIRLA